MLVNKRQEITHSVQLKYFVYILQSKDGRYYTGYTTNLDRRMKQHQNGTGAKFTRGFGFKKILYHEKYRTQSKALRREAEIKRLSRNDKRALMLRTQCKSFPHVSATDAEILILGSMPGERSLQERQYYAHPHNSFWDLMGHIFGAGRQLKYERRLQVLKKNRVALWDVLFQCERNGSLDSNIRAVIPNDFQAFFAKHLRIHTVFFNGHKAEDLFRKFALKNLENNNFRFLRLPSTSPAHASLTREEKKTMWHQAIQSALKGKFRLDDKMCYLNPA